MHEGVIDVKDDDRSLCQSKVDELPRCHRAIKGDGLEAMEPVIIRDEAKIYCLGLHGLVTKGGAWDRQGLDEGSSLLVVARNVHLII